MAVTLGSSGITGVSGSAVSSITTGSIDASAGTDQCLIVGTSSSDDPAQTPTGVTWDVGTPQNFTEAAADSSDEFFAASLWYLVSITQATDTATATWASNVDDCCIYIAEFEGVDQSTPIGNTQVSAGSGTSASVTLTGVSSGDMCVDVIGVDHSDGSNSSTSETPGANQTDLFAEVVSTGSFPMGLSGSYQDGADGGVMSWTIAGSNDYTLIAAALNSAGGGGTIAADAGTYTVTGTDATLDYTSLASDAFLIQHINDAIANSGGTNTSFTAVASLNNAIEVAANNRKTHHGYTTGNQEGDDMAGGRVLTATDTLTYYRESGSAAGNAVFATDIWEYIGDAGGPNEFIVRGRFALAVNGATTTNTGTISGVVDIDNCVPFITGIMNNATTDDADSGTAIAYCSGTDTLNVAKGSSTNNVTIYVTVVEFTGSNWTIHHADSGLFSADTGTFALTDEADGVGAAASVSAQNKALIISGFKGQNTANVDDAISDLWPIVRFSGATLNTLAWEFDANHAAASADNRLFAHVIENSEWTVTVYNIADAGPVTTTFDITSAGLSDLDQSLVVGHSISSGTGTAYARGWRNYQFTSLTAVTATCSRTGNTMEHEIQVVDLSGMTAAAASSDSTITADSGSFSVTGTAANLEHDRLLSADSTSYAITGTDASLLLDATIDAETGAYTVTGTAATLTADYLINADSGSITLTGQDATLTVTGVSNDYTLSADSGTFLVEACVVTNNLLLENGDSLLLEDDSTLLLESGSGECTELVLNRLIDANAGSYAITGADASLIVDRTVSAESGVYTATGQDVSFTVDYAITAESGTFNLTGSDASIISDRTISADSGTYTVVGGEAQLVYTPANSYSLIANTGSYVITGTSANLFADYSLNAESGSFALTGQDATLTVSQVYTLNAESGTFTISDCSDSLLLEDGDNILLEDGSNVLLDQDGDCTRLLVDYVLNAESGTYNCTGQNANLLVGDGEPQPAVVSGGSSIFAKKDQLRRERDRIKQRQEHERKVREEKRKKLETKKKKPKKKDYKPDTSQDKLDKVKNDLVIQEIKEILQAQKEAEDFKVQEEIRIHKAQELKRKRAIAAALLLTEL